MMWRTYGSHKRAAVFARKLQEVLPLERPLLWHVAFAKMAFTAFPGDPPTWRMTVSLRRRHLIWDPSVETAVWIDTHRDDAPFAEYLSSEEPVLKDLLRCARQALAQYREERDFQQILNSDPTTEGLQ